MNADLLFYECVGEFKLQFYKELLTIEHLIPEQIHIKKLRFPDGSEDEEANFWGYQFIKDGTTYLVSSTDENEEEVNLKEMLPMKPSMLQKVADPKGRVYQWIKKPMTMKIRAERTMTPKELIDSFSCLSHTNSKHQKLLWFMALSQIWDRSYYRISTPAGFGKDSVVDLCNSLFGDCGTVESPTIAKLEDRASVLKWLVVNEVVDIGKAEWDVIQQFLLSSGAHKNEITKHSRAFKNVKEIIDLSSFSLSLFYNDVDHYPDMDKYFDFITKKAVRDRFPGFRLYGKYDEDFNRLRDVNVKRLVSDNRDEYIKLLRNFTYYKEHYSEYLHHYHSNTLIQVEGRSAINIGRLLKVIDFYSETQEEYNDWIKIVNDSLLDYQEMLSYPRLIDKLKKKKNDEIDDELKEIKKFNTYKEKNAYIQRTIKCERIYTDNKQVWDTEIL